MKQTINTKKIFTIPNILTVFRILMIPVFAWLYVKKEEYAIAAGVLVLSGVTDVIDGRLARHFGMVSDLGKVLDPFADKLTQVTTLICLISRFPMMLYAVILMFVKEIITAITGILAIRKTHNVYSAVWHGKVTTVLLYILMFLHVVWYDIPMPVSNVMLSICLIMMIISMTLYILQNIRTIKNP